MSHIKQIREHLGGLDCLVLTDPISVHYASGFAFTDGAVVVGRERSWLITDSRYIEAALTTVSDMEILCTAVGKPLMTLIQDCAAACGDTVGAEENRETAAFWTVLQKNLNTPLHAAGSILSGLRASKDEAEIENMIAAQRIAEHALDELLGVIHPGMTEKELAAELVYRLYKFGGEANSFDPIVITGSKTSMPHGVPGDKVICDGDFITMDFGTMYGGYCSDMTRTVAVGHATDEMRKVYDIVLQAQLAGIASARAGVTGKEIDGAARKVITDAGYGEYFGHSFGHSLGLEIHESPNASPVNDKPMPAGAVVSAEPGIYIPGKFGVRIEDVMVLHPDGAEVITKAPKELLVL